MVTKDRVKHEGWVIGLLMVALLGLFVGLAVNDLDRDEHASR